MGRKPWTKPKQLRWLTKNIWKYREAQNQHKLTEFYPEITAAFLQEFPLAPSGAGSIDGEHVATGGENDMEYTEAPNVRKVKNVRYLFINSELGFREKKNSANS